MLPGCGDPKLLPRLSKLQRIVMRKVAEEYGYLYLYVPESLEAEIQSKRTQWVDVVIREYLKIHAHCDIRNLSPRHAEKYKNVFQTGTMVAISTQTVLFFVDQIKQMCSTILQLMGHLLSLTVLVPQKAILHLKYVEVGTRQLALSLLDCVPDTSSRRGCHKW